jgi:hypothetical protein
LEGAYGLGFEISDFRGAPARGKEILNSNIEILNKFK